MPAFDNTTGGAALRALLNAVIAKVDRLTVTQDLNLDDLPKAGQLISALTETLDPADRDAVLLLDDGVSDQKVKVSTAVDQWRTELLGLAVFAADEPLTVSEGIQWIPVPAFLAGWTITGASARTFSQGVTGATTVQILRRRGVANVNVLSSAVSLGAAVYAENGAVNAANDDLAAGDMIGVSVTGIHSGTAPNGLWVTVNARKPGA